MEIGALIRSVNPPGDRYGLPRWAEGFFPSPESESNGRLSDIRLAKVAPVSDELAKSYVGEHVLRLPRSY
jgi:hypothetical protein